MVSEIESTTQDLLSGQISFTGLGSGTDFQTMIDKLTEIEGIHKKRLEIWKEQWETKVLAFQELSKTMLSLKTTLEGMDTPNKFMTRTAESANEALVTASANSEAQEGTHAVSIAQLAQAGITTFDKGFSSKTASVDDNDNTLIIDYGTESFTVSNAGGTTLESLAGKINNDPDNPGVRASIVYDGSEYFLQLRGMDMGDAYDISIGGGSTLSDASTPANWQENQTNQDALVRVDGYPAGDWINVEGNSVKDVVEGVTFDLKGVTGSNASVNVSVGTDMESIKENIRTFVQQTNEVRTMIIELTKFDDSMERGSILTGNYGVQLLSSRMKSATADKALGFQYYDNAAGTGDLYTSLSQLGIKTDAEEGSPTRGLLLLDEEELDAALNNNLDDVVDVFAADHKGEAEVDTGSFAYYNHIKGVTMAGSYDVSYTSDGASVTSATVDGKAASVSTDAEGRVFVTATSGDARGLSFEVLEPTSSGSGAVNLKQGKAGELADLMAELTSSSSGPLHILEDNYNDIISNIDDKIAFEERRLEQYSNRLKLQFARLEATLGRYDQISGQLQSQVGKLE